MKNRSIAGPPLTPLGNNLYDTLVDYYTALYISGDLITFDAHIGDPTALKHPNYASSSSMPFLIRAMLSSLPMISMISVAPAGVICLPETAVRTGHRT